MFVRVGFDEDCVWRRVGLDATSRLRLDRMPGESRYLCLVSACSFSTLVPGFCLWSELETLRMEEWKCESEYRTGQDARSIRFLYGLALPNKECVLLSAPSEQARQTQKQRQARCMIHVASLKDTLIEDHAATKISSRKSNHSAHKLVKSRSDSSCPSAPFLSQQETQGKPPAWDCWSFRSTETTGTRL